MFRTRFWIAVAVVGLLLAPLLTTAGYGWYLRSSWHAGVVARRATAFLNAPVQIGQVVPLDLASKGFRDVAVWLPGEFNPLFTCKTAVLRRGEADTLELELRDGRIDARTDDWDQATLGRLLATAFAHDFQPIRLTTVRLDNMDLIVRRGHLVLRANSATGQVDLSGPAARADLICDGLNGVRATDPIRIHCDFEPGDKPLIRELSLSLPRLGVEAFLPARTRGAAAAGKSAAAPGPIAQGHPAGTFTGTIVYRQADPQTLAGTVELSGNLADVDLAALSQQMAGGEPGLSGLVSGTLDKAVLADGQLRSIQGRLRIDRLDLQGVLALAGVPAAGTATLNLYELRYDMGSLQALLADGQVRDLDVEPLLLSLRAGSMSGRLNAELQKIKIVDGRLEELTGEARVLPPAGAPGTIDRSILDATVRRFCNMPLPPVLPDKVKYVDLGARFRTEAGDLYIDGLSGPEGQYILVAEVGPVPMPLLPTPADPIPLRSLWDRAEGQVSRLCQVVAGWMRTVG